MSNNEQQPLFSDASAPRRGDAWRTEWVGMPAYDNIEVAPPAITATFKFRNEEDFQEFNRLIREHIYGGQRVFDGTQRKDVKSTWYPLNVRGSEYQYE